MLDTIGGFEKLGPVTLSLNGNEANQLARACNLKESSREPEDLERLARELRTRSGVSNLGIHLTNSATAASANECQTVLSPYCPKPLKCVGAGDRFNAGWLCAQLLNFPMSDQLTVASAVSGFFVRNARSATWDELIQFLRKWSSDLNPCSE